MNDSRVDCPMRHENGNCTVAGGFCTSVNDPICEALHDAYDCGYRRAAHGQNELQWIPAEDGLPELVENVLVIASGKPCENVTLENAIEIAAYSEDSGWILDSWPEWENPNVTYWMPLPPLPMEENKDVLL